VSTTEGGILGHLTSQADSLHALGDENSRVGMELNGLKPRRRFRLTPRSAIS